MNPALSLRFIAEAVVNLTGSVTGQTLGLARIVGRMGTKTCQDVKTIHFFQRANTFFFLKQEVTAEGLCVLSTIRKDNW